MWMSADSLSTLDFWAPRAIKYKNGLSSWSGYFRKTKKKDSKFRIQPSMRVDTAMATESSLALIEPGANVLKLVR